MDPVQNTESAALIAVIIAAIGLAATAIYRIGKLTEATKRMPQEMKIELQRINDRIDQHETLNQERIRHTDILIRNVEEIVRFEAEKTREQIRSLHQAKMSHSHDEDGSIIFRIPPPEPDE